MAPCFPARRPDRTGPETPLSITVCNITSLKDMSIQKLTHIAKELADAAGIALPAPDPRAQ